MAPNKESDTSEAQVPSHPSSEGSNETPQKNEQNQQQTDNSSAFSHPGAKLIAQRAEDGDGPYRCRNCGDAILTVSVRQCPGCLDNYPWFSLFEEPEVEDRHA